MQYRRAKCDYFERNPRAHVPPHTLRGIDRYVEDQVEPGQFLMSLLENDLAGTVLSADEWNLTNLHGVVIFTFAVIPTRIRGSQEKVHEWISGGDDASNDS